MAAKFKATLAAKGPEALGIIGVDIVGAKAGLHQLGRGIALPHRPLPSSMPNVRMNPATSLAMQCRANIGYGLRPDHPLEVAVNAADANLADEMTLEEYASFADGYDLDSVSALSGVPVQQLEALAEI